jgi:hypothetical protein
VPLPRWLLPWLVFVLAMVGPAAAQTQTPVPAPLTGTVTPSSWVLNDSNYPGITLACGKPFHYILAQPPQYNPTQYKYPLYVWLHPDGSGNSNYIGSGGDLYKMASAEAGSYNTTAFQTRHPSFIAAPSADQTNGNGSTGSCTGGYDSAIRNWGGWSNNGTVGSGTNYSGDNGPNTYAVVAMVNDLKARYSIDPARIYVNGFSLGGHGTQTLCYHYNAYTGDRGKIFAACGGIAGADHGDEPITSAKATKMVDVPQWIFSGANDGTSPPSVWGSPLCSALGGNPASLTAITSPSANRCGTSQMRYTLMPGVGHSNSDSSGQPIWTNQVINDFIFAQSASVTTQPAGTGQFSISNGKVIDPNGNTFVAHGINVDEGEAPTAITNAAAQPLTTLFPHINFIRVPVRATTNVGSASATYPNPAIYATWVKRATDLGIVVEFEDHNSNGGQWECFISGSLACTPSYPPTGGALTTMLNFWTSLANMYKGNPYVWIGSLNEINSGDGTYSTSAISATTNYENALYNAIRGTGNRNIIQMGNGVGGGNCGTVGSNSGQSASTIGTWTNIVWYIHSYYTNGTTVPNSGYTNAPAYLAGQTGSQCGGSGGSGYLGAQTLRSADGLVPVIFDEWGSGTGSSSNGDASSIVAAISAAHGLGHGFSGWAWFPSAQWQMVNNGATSGGPFSLTTWGQQVANLISTLPGPTPPGSVTATESLAVTTIASVPVGTTFTVSGTISNATAAPSLQYQDNGGAWQALPAGASVSATAYSFTHPAMAANGAAVVAIRDANNTSISAASAPFVVRGPESASNTIAVPTTVTVTANFSDTFTSLPLHNTWQSGDKWQLVAPDTPNGRGGANFGENGDQWWVNPFNSNTPISGIYVQDSTGLHLGLLNTPPANQSYINTTSGSTLPYVGALMNTSQTSYQKYGYWEFKVAVPKLAGFTWQADTENVQVTGTWPPEIDLRIGTNAAGVQTVLFQFALGGGQYTQYTAPSTFNATQMHTYGWDWEADFITFFIDNVQVFQAPNPSAAYSTNPMFIFLVTAANYIGNTGDPLSTALPVSANVQAVNVYPARPGTGAGPSATITDANGNTFFITSSGKIAINGTVDGTTANVTELAYVNHVLWQENTAGNWYNFLGTPGSYGGPTTTSPLTGVAETLAVNSIGAQTSNTGFAVSGTISGLTSAPTLQYQDNAGTWQALPAGSTVSSTAFSFPHPGLSAGQYTVSVRDATNTGITGTSTTFSVAQSTGESIAVNPVGSQTAGQSFTVTGTMQNVPGAVVGTDWSYNPGQDGSFWKKPFQSSAKFITSGSLITALRGGTPSINTKGNFAVPWVRGSATDPLVRVTDGTRSINVHMPVGTIIETPTSSFDQSIGGSDAAQPYLVWSISGATMNTGSVQANGSSVITGTYGFSIQDGAGLMMVDIVTGTPGSNNSIGNLQDYELAQIQADPNYVIPHMMAFQLDSNTQASSAGPIWPLKITDVSNGSYSGPIPQGVTIGIPANVPRPPGKTRAWYALFDQLQQQGMFNYNFGATGGVNFMVYDQSGAYGALISDLQTAWTDIGHNYIAILDYTNGAAGAQYSLSTTKGAVAGSTDAFPAPPPLDLSPTGGLNVSPNSFGAWYPNTSYSATPTNPGAPVGAPTLQYQDGSGAWQALPADAVVTGSTFTFTHPAMSATSSGKISIRDAAHTTVVGSSNVFSVNSTAVEQLAITTIPTQQANVAFNVAGSIANVTLAPSLQYQDNGGAWQALPAGSSVSTTAFSFTHPGVAATTGQTVAVRDAAATAITAVSNTFAILLAESQTNTLVTTVGPVVVDATGEAFGISSGGQVTVNGVVDTTTSNIIALAYVNHLVWKETSGGIWSSKAISTAPWSAGTTVSPLPPETLAVGFIGGQVVGIPFAVSGTIGNALIVPTLQYSVSNGPWVSFPAGSTVTTTGFSLTIPGVASAGPATVSVRDAGTQTITATSGTFTVAAPPVEQLAFASIPSQLANVAFRVTGTIANATTIPTLQYNVNGGAYQALPSGSPASLTTQTSFAFTVPGVAAGTATIGVRDANAPGITAQSNSFQVGTPVGETLAIANILGQLAGQSFSVTGSIGNATSIPSLQYSINGGLFVAWPAADSPITLTSFTLVVPPQSAGAKTITVRDVNTPSVAATSNSFQVAPLGNPALTINPISVQPVGTAFAVSGTVTNVTAAPTLQYSDNGGPFLPLPAGASVTTTSFSFIHPGLGASQSVTVVVRDANRTTVAASAPPFGVIARESPNLTVVTTVGPQIVDSVGNTWALTAGAQVSENGTALATTSNVIEVAYVNRQVWYENTALNWWVFSNTGTWSPTGGTALGPLPSSKANIYLTKTAKLAVVTGFSVAVPGIVVNDTVVSGAFNVSVKATNGVVTMPGAVGAGTASMTETGTLGAINQSLSGLQYMGKTIGNGVVSITVTDSAKSVAAANVNIAVVRAAPVIQPGR